MGGHKSVFSCYKEKDKDSLALPHWKILTDP